MQDPFLSTGLEIEETRKSNLACSLCSGTPEPVRKGRKPRGKSEVCAFLNVVWMQRADGNWSRCRQLLSQGVTLTMKGLEEEKMSSLLD